MPRKNDFVASAGEGEWSTRGTGSPQYPTGLTLEAVLELLGRRMCGGVVSTLLNMMARGGGGHVGE